MSESEVEITTFQDTKGQTITAAAQILSGPKIERRTRRKPKGMPWQQAAWEFVDEVGEFSWAVELLATNVSKIQLVAARDVQGVDEPVILDGTEYEVDGETRQPTQIELDAAALVGAFAGGTVGQQQLLYRAAFQLIVAAESFIVGRTDAEGESRWDAFSNEEMIYNNGGWEINDGTEKYRLTDDDVLIRVWRPHPRRRNEPRSSTKPLLPVLAEIKGLTQSIAARIDSRLAGAGVLFVPESMSLMSNASAEVVAGQDPFVAELMASMLTSIVDRDTAAAVVPIVVRVPDEAIGKVQHIRFEVTAKAEEAQQRQDAILRMARSVDLPPEQVLGMGETNHWSAWQLSEDTVKGPVATLAAILAHAFSVGYMRPALVEMGHPPEEVAELLEWFDLTTLIQRPDRSEQAFNIYGVNGLSLDALLRESGFDDADKPSDEDLCRQMLLTLIKSDPANAKQWVSTFGPCSGLELPSADLFETPVDSSAVIEQPPVAEDDIQNNRDIPEQTLAASAVIADHTDCLYATCEVAVLRALDYAGKRMRGSSPRNLRSGFMTIPTHELHANPTLVASLGPRDYDELLNGAWAQLDIALPGRSALVADLDVYTRGLIERQELHDPEQLRALVKGHV